MKEPKKNDVVWWFCCESSHGNVYPSWLNLLKATIIWVSPYEEVAHGYIDGENNIFTLFYGTNELFESKEKAIEGMSSRLIKLSEEFK